MTNGRIDLVSLSDEFTNSLINLLFSQIVQVDSFFNTEIVSCHHVWLSPRALTYNEWKIWIQGLDINIVVFDELSGAKAALRLLAKDESQFFNTFANGGSIPHFYILFIFLELKILIN